MDRLLRGQCLRREKQRRDQLRLSAATPAMDAYTEADTRGPNEAVSWPLSYEDYAGAQVSGPAGVGLCHLALAACAGAVTRGPVT